jgi:hypothetical protein
MDVKETLKYLKSQISGSVSLPGNWICLVTSPYPPMTQEKVLQFMSCLETRLLACQRICCDHILPKIYLTKRGYTSTGTRQPDTLWSVPLEFWATNGMFYIQSFLCIQTLRPSQYSVAVFGTILLGKRNGFVFGETVVWITWRTRIGQSRRTRTRNRSDGNVVTILMDQELFHGKIREWGWAKIRKIYWIPHYCHHRTFLAFWCE